MKIALQKGLVLSQQLNKKSSQGGMLLKDSTPYENVGNKYGSVLKFLGTDSDYVRIPDSASFAGGANISAFAWVKGIAQDSRYVMSQYDGPAIQRAWSISTSNISPYSNLRVLISDNGTFDAGHRKMYYANNVAFDDTWYFVGFTFNAGILKLYIDGVEVDVTKTYDDAITSIHNSTADIIVGSGLANNVPTSLITGSIGDSRIYNRTLTPAEVLTMYQGGVVNDNIQADNIEQVTGDNSDFDTVGNWVGAGGATVTGGYDSGDAGYDKTLRIEAGDIGSNRAELPLASFVSGGITVGKEYRISFDYKWITQTGTTRVALGNKNDTTLGTETSWTNHSIDLIPINNTDPLRIYANISGSVSDELLIDNVTVKQIGVVAHYKMKDKSGTTLTDETTNNNGTLTNFADTTAGYGDTHTSGWTTNDTPIVYALDRKGNLNGISFDGDSDYVRISDADCFNVGSYMSVFAWVKGVAIVGVFLSQYDYGVNQRAWFIRTSDSKLSIALIEDGINILKKYKSNSDIIDGNWHQVGFTFDIGVLKLYIDGIEADVTKETDIAMTSIYNSTADIIIGSDLDTDVPSNFFNGSIDDARIYNRVLSQDEITFLYNQYHSKILI